MPSDRSFSGGHATSRGPAFNRRRFLRTTAALLALPTGALLLQACGAPPAPTATTAPAAAPAPTTAPAAAPAAAPTATTTAAAAAAPAAAAATPTSAPAAAAATVAPAA